MEKRSERINLRVTAEEKVAWEKAANGSVSTWLRNLANAEAHSDWYEPSAYQKVAQEKKAEEMALISAAVRSVAECPRWMHHRPGVYCGACNR